MQTIVIGQEKFLINQEIDVVGNEGVRKIVQLGSGAWCLGLTNPPSYINGPEDIQDFEIPAPIRKRILDDVEKRKDRLKVEAERREQELQQKTSATLRGTGDMHDESLNALVTCLEAMTVEDRWGLLDVIKKHLSLVQDSITQGEEVNSAEGYGQGQDVPTYQEPHPQTGTRHYRNPDAPKGIDMTLEENMIDSEDPAKFKAYQESLDRKENKALDQESFIRQNDQPMSLEEELDVEIYQ